MSIKLRWGIRIYFLLGLIISGAGAAGSGLRLSGSGGLDSPFDYLNLGLPLLMAAAGLFFFWNLLRTFRSDQIFDRLQALSAGDGMYWAGLIFSFLLLVESFQDLVFLQAGLPVDYYPILLRENSLLLLWSGLLGLLTVVVLIVLGWKKAFRMPALRWDHVFLGSGILLGVILLISARQGSLNTNAPIPFLHILLVSLLVALGGWGAARLRQTGTNLASIFRSDVLALVVLWLVSFMIWSRLPLEPNGFIDQVRPPDNLPVPISDAIYYEQQSHSFLAGEGFGDNAQHTLYSFLLSGLHLIGGSHYTAVYRLQIILLALFPFMMYKISSLLGSRFTGWVLGGLMIVREYTAIILGNTITVSNVQVLMTEPTAALGVALFIYLTILWMREGGEIRGRLVLLAAVAGLLGLIRIELLYLVFLLIPLSLVVYWKKWRLWLGSSALALLAGMLVILPWAIRNTVVTGSPVSGKSIIFERAFESPAAAGDPVEAGQPSRIPGLLEYGLSKSRRMWFRFSTSTAQSLVYLPSNHLPLLGLDQFIEVVPDLGQVRFFREGLFSDAYLTSYVKSLPYWHISWKGEIASRSAVPLLMALLGILLGIRQAWRIKGWSGLVPLIVYAAHLLVYAFFDKSGGRYIQLVDWVSAFYLVLGINWLAVLVLRPHSSSEGVLGQFGLFFDQDGALNQHPGHPERAAMVSYILAGVVMVVGLSLPAAELLIPERYTPDRLKGQLSVLPVGQTGADAPDFKVEQAFNPGSDPAYAYGMALYPSYFAAGEKLRDDRSGFLPPPDSSRVVFYLVGPRSIWVSLPVAGPPAAFPHGTDVLVKGSLVRNTTQDREQRLKPYFLADEILILEAKHDLPGQIIRCDLDPCSP